MSGPIGRVPRGLLDFFRLTTQGRNPASLSDTIALTFDAMRWYVDGESGDYTITDAVLPTTTALGDIVPFTTTSYGDPLPDNGTVPAAEVWLLRAWTTTGLVPTGATQLAWSPIITPPNFAGTGMWMPPHIRGAGASAALPYATVQELPMLIPPGYQMAIFVNAQVGTLSADYTVSSGVRLTRFHI